MKRSHGLDTKNLTQVGLLFGLDAALHGGETQDLIERGGNDIAFFGFGRCRCAASPLLKQISSEKNQIAPFLCLNVDPETASN